MPKDITIRKVPALLLLLQKLKDNRQKIIDESNSIAEKKILKICRKAIDNYYSDYSPFIYNRTESLYNAYDVYCDGDCICIEFNSDLDASHRVDSVDPDYIYDVMFKEGWHGGAMSGPGHPSDGEAAYWRTPVTAREMYIESIDEIVFVRPYALWYSHPAKKSKAPYGEIISNITTYWNDEYPEDILSVMLNCIK